MIYHNGKVLRLTILNKSSRILPIPNFIYVIRNYKQQISKIRPMYLATIVFHSLNSNITYCNIIRQRHFVFSCS